MLRILGKNEYGIYSLAASVIAYLNLLSLGFGASYIRFYSKFKKDNDEASIKRMNGLYLGVFSLMGLISLIIGLILAQNTQIFLNDTYSSEEVSLSKILMAFLAVNVAISFPASVFTSYVTSQERFIFQKLLNLGKTVIGPAVNIIVLYLGYGSFGMVVSTTIISLVIDIVNVYYCIKKLKMKISFKNPDFKLLRDIFVFSIFIAINHVINQINWQTDKVVLGKLVNGGAVAVYSVGSQINSLFINFSLAISSVFAPKVNMIVQENKEDMDRQLTSLFVRIGRIQWFLLSLILLGFIFFGQYFIYRWAGKGYENAYWVALLLMLPAIVPLSQNIGIEIQRAKNKHQVRSIAYLIMALINVGISIVFALLWGEIGAAFGTTISLLLADILFMNIYYQTKLGVKVTEYWKSIIKASFSFIPSILFGLIVVKFYSFNSLLDFGIMIVAFSFVYLLSICLFGFNKEEKGIIKNLLRKNTKR